MSTKFKNAPKILGLDISTKTIGWALFDINSSKLLEFPFKERLSTILAISDSLPPK